VKPKKVKVTLFKPSGKYYTEEEWTIPDLAMGPWDMQESPDFHRIDNGPVLIPSQEPWGYPFLLMRYYVTEQGK
jgi:hypothetical protein